jgi:hypothetical protein
MTERTLRAAAAAATLLAGTALATPAQKCVSDKNKEAGKYVECRQKAEAKFALTGDGTMRALALQKCADKYARRWPQIEDKAGGACPSTGDQTAVQQYVDATTTDVAAALSGGTLAGQAQPLTTGLTQCWNTAGQLIACAGTGQDGDVRAGLDRVYVDNGDGTITDTRTGLTWEKLSDDTSIHDKDNIYTWGNAFTHKIAVLNQERFGGYADWRLPNVNELHSLVNYGSIDPAVSPAFNTGCGQWCTVLTCSCTRNNLYWASSSFLLSPGGSAWTVGFYSGGVSRNRAKVEPFYVRAVRGGS